MLGTIKKLIGDEQQRKLKKYQKIVERINKLEPQIEKLSDEELQAKTTEFKDKLANGKALDDIKPEAFAVVREASKRVLGLRHYDVQLIGGLVLNEGDISEMPTGEGKTLVASLPSYLRALEGKGVHVITVNEYLAKRDRELIGQVHEFLGLTVGLNISQLPPAEKKAAYQADITYGIGNEFGFDLLRDNMVYSVGQRVQRPFHFAIIDEIDSVLVDEAKTPLIIAGKTQVNPSLYHICAKMARSFKADEDYLYDPITKSTNLTDDGITKVERAFGIDNLYDLEHQTLYHFVLQALRARVMFRRDVDYIVKEGQIQLVDMFTGRVMEGRTFSDGLHQALEAKEGLQITEENKTQAMITIQNYFRMYPKLSGMTGTAKTEEKEFQMLYGMDVIQVPTNKPRIREDKQDIVFATTEQKYKAVANEVKKRHETGQPVLIGTASIIQSETMATYLDEAEIPYELLNAKSVENEVQLISLAGQKHQVTIATNMAGRGTDIMLGEGVAELGGLFVLGTERHESRRIDNQLKGRSGRQGDPGETQFFISIEDEMIQRFGRDDIDKFKHENKLTTDSDGVITNKDIYTLIDRAQRMCEDANYAAREYTLKLDNIVNEQRNVIYELRNRVLESDDPLSILLPMIESSAEQFVEQYCPKELLPEEWNLTELSTRLNHILADANISFGKDVVDVSEVKEIVAEKSKNYIEKLKQLSDNENVQAKCNRILLMTIDFHWLQHIEEMNRLKEGIGLRGYSQEDPMRIYTREGYELFTIMYHSLERDASIHLTKVTKPYFKENEGEQ
ncbi:accessory Sec system translocase SecA2 [Desertibacillus haloalkaliphilus]|uniref:accessory Sec system translocase SecA2 n=1 Tax=Desertibacillus haloalkaliphilus TaxID=1328930 RepID=UPI001C25CE7C|nr:accessory Sec system translocase SecA2 [Desertibacillus haloalkaliphilus]MBU8905969.1 accessory Sec system translocase SecA2 [Desertibacillus haloalkaliphilus]